MITAMEHSSSRANNYCVLFVTYPFIYAQFVIIVHQSLLTLFVTLLIIKQYVNCNSQPQIINKYIDKNQVSWHVSEESNDLLLSGRQRCDGATMILPQVVEDAGIAEHIPVRGEGRYSDHTHFRPHPLTLSWRWWLALPSSRDRVDRGEG